MKRILMASIAVTAVLAGYCLFPKSEDLVAAPPAPSAPTAAPAVPAVKPAAPAAAPTAPAAKPAAPPAAIAAKVESPAEKMPTDWPQWGGTPERNNVPEGKDICTDWNIGAFDRTTGEWQREKSKNIKWVARLGSQSYGNPVVSDGKIFVGTNNGHGYLKRYPSTVDLGCMLCFDEKDGKFLWQHSSEKLPAGRVNDWPMQGVCSAALVEGKRVWFVTNRGEVRCLDTEGFHDGKNNGPYTTEPNEDKDEADVIWVLDMMKELGVSQHNMANCSVTAIGDVLYVITSNGVDEAHLNIPAPNAPSFIAVNKNTGKVLWTDKSPGENIVHGQWSSPCYAVLGGVPQVIFGGGDGYIYSFRGDSGDKPELLWKFDVNPKVSKFILGGAGTRNDIIATPVPYKGLVYVSVGQDPEHGEGPGRLWCIDPTKRGDVSPELAFNTKDLTKPIPHKRVQAVIPEDGEVARPNPNSAVVWEFSEQDRNGDGEISFEETMHRSIGTVAIKNDLVFVADFSGLFHCVDAKTGKSLWSYDMLAASWGSPLIVEDKVYIGDEDGDVAIFKLSGDPKVAMKDDGGDMKPAYNEINVGNSVYSTPVVANNILFIANKTHLFAITPDGK